MVGRNFCWLYSKWKISRIYYWRKVSKYLFLKWGSRIEFYLKYVICPMRARKLHFISIMRGYCFLRRAILEHFSSEYFRGNCFDCLLKNVLKNILIERNHQKYLFRVNVDNFNDVSDSDVMKKMIVIVFSRKRTITAAQPRQFQIL